MNMTIRHRWAALGLAASALLLAGCDPQRISELEEGLSTEADVRERFGPPEAVWDAPEGGQVYEYNRQPAGDVNYQITIGADGKMTALRQVLNAQNFAQITPGLMMEDVRRRLGKPMKITSYELKRETHYDWRYRDGPNNSNRKVFTVVFDRDLRVLSTLSVRDPELDQSSR
jgi:hypothetical protein